MAVKPGIVLIDFRGAIGKIERRTSGYTNLTLMTPSLFENEGGYSPAESFCLTLTEEKITELIAALRPPESEA